jgi:uncharacterized membrane protein YeaQ/YmgE (transglycosylase-associated protein family)
VVGTDQRIRPRGRTTREIIGVVIAGIVIGLLGKWIAPNHRDNIGLWLTVVCGVGGVLVGCYLAAAAGVAATPGIDWARWVISIVVAAILCHDRGRFDRATPRQDHRPARAGSLIRAAATCAAEHVTM